MTKTLRRRTRALVELIDETPVGGAAPCAPSSETWPPESFETFYRREYPRILVLDDATSAIDKETKMRP